MVEDILDDSLTNRLWKRKSGRVELEETEDAGDGDEDTGRTMNTG